MDLITLVMDNVDKSSGTFTATVVVAGILIVVVMLLLLIFIFEIFGKVVSKGANTKKSKAKKVEDAPIVVESTPAPVAKANNGGVTGEIVAAISAAIYQLEGENAVISSITPVVSNPVPVRKQNPITCRNPWAQAAIVENTMSF